MNKTVDRYGTMLRIFDNGGKTLDQYTILPSRFDKKYRDNNRLINGIGSSTNPYHPQGFGMWITAEAGRHLGKRISLNDLPEIVLQFARESFPEYFLV